MIIDTDTLASYRLHLRLAGVDSGYEVMRYESWHSNDCVLWGRMKERRKSTLVQYIGLVYGTRSIRSPL